MRKSFFLLFFIIFTPLFGISSEKKKTICLNMIVKNEKEVITRCLESVLPIIDTWVIVDTGSTDGTQKIIKDFLKKIPGELHERPWVNFGYNRQEALLLAKEKADYIIFMDADDILVFSDEFKMPELISDFYAIPSSTASTEYWFPRLVKSSLNWFWNGIIHEDLLCKETVTGTLLLNVKYLYIHDGARAKDPNKSLKDIELLHQAIKDQPENPRNFFYLARSYLAANLPNLALDYFKKRAEMSGNQEEIFLSNLMIGRLQDALLLDSKIVENSFLKAYLNRPHRAEPLYYLALKFYERNEYQKASEILSLALKLPSFINDYMSLEKWIYDYGLLLQFALCAEQTGDYEKGIQACEEILKRSDLPKDVKTKVATQFELLHQKNITEIQKKLFLILNKETN